MSPEEPKFVIRSEGIVGFVEITFTEELLNHDAPFRCTQLVSHNYQTAFLKTVLKACNHSECVSFRIDKNGILQVQHLVVLTVAEGKQENVFLMFFVRPDFEKDESFETTLSS